LIAPVAFYLSAVDFFGRAPLAATAPANSTATMPGGDRIHACQFILAE
jgi:hypothetical protein